MATLQEMAVSALTFNKRGLTKAGESKDSTGPAVILLLIASLLSGIIGYTTESTAFGNPFDPSDVEPVTALVSNFVGQLLLFLIISFVLSIFLGSQATTMEVFRVTGATSVWTSIGSIVGFFFLGLSGLIGLIGFIALIIGLSGISKKGELSTFIRVIIAWLIGFFLVFLIIVFVVVAIVSVLFLATP